MNNYICLTRLEELIKNIKNNINAYEALELSSIFYWLDSTVTGDIAECNGFSKRHYNKIWNLISSKSDFASATDVINLMDVFIKMLEILHQFQTF